METLYRSYAVAGVLSVVLVLASRRIRTLPVTEPLVALVVGVLLGPHVLSLLVIPTESRTTLLLEATRLMLAVSVIGVALRYPVSGLRPILRPVSVLVVLGMPAFAAAAGGLAVVLAGLPVALAVLLGACLCPTDRCSPRGR